LVEVVTDKVKKTESHTFSFSETLTQTSTYFSSFLISCELYLYGWEAELDLETQLEFSYTFQNSVSVAYGSEYTVTNEVDYSISKTVNVRSCDTVKISSYVNWINNLQLNYNASVDITLSQNCGSLLPTNYTQYVLNMIGFTGTLINSNNFILTYFTSGYIIASKGLDSQFNATSCGQNKECLHKFDYTCLCDSSCSSCSCDSKKAKRNVHSPSSVKEKRSVTYDLSSINEKRFVGDNLLSINEKRNVVYRPSSVNKKRSNIKTRKLQN